MSNYVGVLGNQVFLFLFCFFFEVGRTMEAEIQMLRIMELT